MTLAQMQTVRYGDKLKQSDADFINASSDTDDCRMRKAKQMAHCYKIYPLIYNHNS